MKYLIAAALLAMTSTTGLATELEPWQIKGAELAAAEPKIYEAYWSQNISLWVSVKDNGTNRAGYADYICLVLNQAGRPQGEFVAVTVWDVKGLGTNNSKQLGKTYCQ